MPPPISPTASPRLTARTTGVPTMKRQPSFSSENAWVQLARAPMCSACRSFRLSLGSASRQMMAAEMRKVSVSNQNATDSWLIWSQSRASICPSCWATLASSANTSEANGNVP